MVKRFDRNPTRTTEQNREKYTLIPLPRISKSVECYVEGAEKPAQRVSMGTVNLGKLGWQLNTYRWFGKIKELYVLGKFQAPT
jgi:hypothetical protein